MENVYTPPLQYFIRQSYKRFISLSLVTTGLIILIRLYELIFISGKAGYPAGSSFDVLEGLQYDLLLSLRLSFFLLLPFLWIDHYNRKYARIFYASLTIAVIVGEVVLLRYFATTRIPLGADLFGYSAAEINQTVGASGELSIGSFLTPLLFLAISIYAYRKWNSFKVSFLTLIIFSFAMFISILPFVDANPDPADYKSEFSMNIAANKFNLFSSSVYSHFRQKEVSSKFELNVASSPTATEESKLNSDGNSEASQSEFLEAQNQFTYFSKEYPFLHKENTPNLLEPFFQPKTSAPSIVFILVESLGRAYSGEGAYLGSFTPFLDSLMNKSLYWENCLSTSGRTFSVIPSLMASLPFAEKGFADLGTKMPDHLSMISLLKKQAAYTSSFYYGGDPSFDSMESFLRRQGTSRIIGIKDFGSDYQKLPASKEGFTWGYGEKEMFRKYLSDLKANEKEKRLDVMLTLAMHNPFKVPNQAYFNDLFEKRMSAINLSEEQKKYNRQYTAQFASMLYFDDALRYFFQEFSKLKSFENTIFILTGDHRMPEIPISTQIDRFHVPLVIYSPMLKEGHRFSSVVTHFDVAPSMLAFLKGRLNIKLPAVTAWIGHGLDTQTAFRNLNSYPLKRNTGELIDYLSGDYFISGKTLYKIGSDLNIEVEDNPEVNNQLQKQFTNYKAKNQFATRGNYLIPDSLKKYILP